MNDNSYHVKNLVLDAGPILSLSPLRGLAERYFTVPQVLAELKDPRVKEHFARLGLTAGVQVEVRQPDPPSIAKVTLFAKKTGDYAVLSAADLAVLALTYSLDEEHKRQTSSVPGQSGTNELKPEILEPVEVQDEDEFLGSPPLEDVLEQCIETPDIPSLHVNAEAGSTMSPSVDLDESQITPASTSPIVFEDPSDEDDGEGKWITPSNVALHKSRALALLPGASPGIRKGKDKLMGAGCMTADYAMQNVLLQMGLNLVGVEGKRIAKVKNWVLRCHACFKLCKDSSKKFCPSCGNPTLLRTSVTTTAGTSTSPPVVQVHLKKNFQYRNRGTVYPIAMPKPGTSKAGPGTGLILREDQPEFMRAMKREEGRLQREEKRLVQAVAGSKEGASEGVKIGNWADPDWMPEMLDGKARKAPQGLPLIGHGRKNPNERKRRK